MNWKPYNYQKFACDHIWHHPYCGLFLDMGLGKTVISLTAINRMIYEECEYSRALIVAPKHVTRTVWKQEAAKWDHLKHLKVSIVWGTPKERIAALRVKADIYVINRENLCWLVTQFQSKFPFPVVYLDELSSFKNRNTKRFKALEMVRPQIKRLIGLTGTPSPNGLMDLWGPLFLMDQGIRLEKTIGGYRERYFAPEKMQGYITYSYRLRKDAEQIIYSKISDICISMKGSDYLDLPPLIENNIILELDDEIQEKYDEFERESIMEIVDKEITALNAAALTNKLLQFANGAIYHEDRSYSVIHDTKIDALRDIIDDSMGQPILVFYAYQHDMKRIIKAFPYARMLKTPKDMLDWNEGKIQLAIAHPASAGHGLNLQHGGSIMVWFGLTWSLELYMQAIARLFRQGQTKSVIVHRLIMRYTMDMDVVKAIVKKMHGQEALMNAVKARINKHTSKAA